MGKGGGARGEKEEMCGDCVGRINSHVQGTRPNAVSAFLQSISSARTQLNTITFTYYATCISRYYVSCYALRVNRQIVVRGWRKGEF